MSYFTFSYFLFFKTQRDVLEKKNALIQNDLEINQKGKIKLKQKLKDNIKQHEEEKLSLEKDIQNIKKEKAETCNALRVEFGSALDNRDSLVSSLRGKLDVLNAKKLENEEKYEVENRQLTLKLTDSNEKNMKLESDLSELRINLENARANMSEIRREKDNIGDSIRAEFDNICSGLRMDLERVLKEKDELARAMEVY